MKDDTVLSLDTTDKQEAKRRHAQKTVEFQARWQSWHEALVDGPKELDQRTIFALSGEIAARLIDDHSDNPGRPEDWLKGDGSPQRKLLRQERSVKALFDLIDFELAKRRLIVTPKSRQALIDLFLDKDRKVIFETLAKRADGDYSDPQALALRPKVDWDEVRGDRPPSSSPFTFDAMHKLWLSRRNGKRPPAANTQSVYRSRLYEFSDFLGHDDARRVLPEDIERYLAHLGSARIAKGRRGAGQALSPKTIAERLVTLTAYFRVAVAARKLAVNPVEGLIPYNQTSPQVAFTEQEATAILRAARKETGFRRWAPWLMAYSGMRVEEAGQIRKSDVFQLDGVWLIHITPDAGHTKSNRARHVPIHSAVAREGFLEFVSTVNGERLFPKACLNRHGLRSNTNGKWCDNGSGIIGDWLGRLAITDKQPSHGWRHWFKQQALRGNIREEAFEKIIGHGSELTGRKHYATAVDPKWLKSEIEKLPKVRL